MPGNVGRMQGTLRTLWYPGVGFIGSLTQGLTETTLASVSFLTDSVEGKDKSGDGSEKSI